MPGLDGNRALLALVVVLVGACTASPDEEATVSERPSSTATAIASTTSTTSDRRVITVPYRVERRTSDPATDDFEQVVRATLADPRGWVGANFVLTPSASAEFVVILAEGQEVDRLCFPYSTRSLYSCQIGPVVALNADRWRTATPQWTGDLASYKVMLVNHEVGHLLGQKHPDVQCPGAGQPAPVMAQQSTELGRCLPNPWPLRSEIERAARHDLPLAPPFER